MLQLLFVIIPVVGLGEGQRFVPALPFRASSVGLGGMLRYQRYQMSKTSGLFPRSLEPPEGDWPPECHLGISRAVLSVRCPLRHWRVLLTCVRLACNVTFPHTFLLFNFFHPKL